MRKELDEVINSFYLDPNHPERQLIRRSHREFRPKVATLATEVGPKFWGIADRQHPGRGAPTWPANAQKSDL